jgi:hypothetical protein
MSTSRHWFFSPAVLITGFISLAALGLAGLVLLLLPSTAEIIGVMQWRMVTAKSFAFEVDADYQGTRGKVNFDLKKENWHWHSSGRTASQGDDTDATQDFALSVGSGTDALDFAGKLHAVGGQSYVFFDRAPEKAGSFNIGAFTSQWLRLDIGKIREAYDLPFVGGGESDSSAAAAVRDELRRTPFFTLVRRLPDDRASGVKVHRYLVVPEKIYMKDFVERSESARLGRELTEDERQQFERLFSWLVPEQSEIWIGANDLYLRRIHLIFRFDDGIHAGRLELTALFRDFNADTAVTEAPKESRDVSSILERLAPGLIAHLPLAKVGTQQVEKTAVKPAEPVMLPGDADSDSDGLSDLMELFLGSNPRDPDTNKDGIKDGESLDKGLDPAGSGLLFDFGITSGGR